MEVFRGLRRSEMHASERLDAVSKSKTSGRIFDKLFVRHWDTWSNGTRSNLFVAPVNLDGRAGTPVNVSKALDADVPSKPDGGDEEFVFSPDGSNVVFSARVAGRAGSMVDEFRSLRSAVGRHRHAQEPDRRQPGVGHAAGVSCAMATSRGSR